MDKFRQLELPLSKSDSKIDCDKSAFFLIYPEKSSADIGSFFD
jgi:hypothetical protein